MRMREMDFGNVWGVSILGYFDGFFMLGCDADSYSWRKGVDVCWVVWFSEVRVVGTGAIRYLLLVTSIWGSPELFKVILIYLSRA